MAATSLSLLDRARSSGGDDAWQRLISIYTPLLRTWMQRYGLQASDADDVVQEVLLTVARELPAFEHSGRTGAFRHWLKSVLTHRLQNFWRSRRQMVNEPGSRWMEQLRELEDDASRVSRIWDAEHDRHVLAQLLGQVRPRFEPRTWEAFQRLMFAGEPPDVVASALGMAVHSVYVAKSRVLNALRQEAAGLVDPRSSHVIAGGSSGSP